MSGFFGFDSDVPALGAGKFDDLDAALPDDEDIDIVNDETFGAGAVFDGDWEQAHEKLAEELETFKYATDGQTYRHSSTGDDDRGMREDDYHQSDTFTSQEDDLEKSLSQLVVDDDEIDDPAIMNLSKNRPIPQVKNNNLDNLFGPSSPPAFLNTEHLVSPGKTNIWGSPVTRESYMDPTPPKDDGGIKNLLSMLQAKPSNQASSGFQDPSIVIAGKPTPLPNARSLDELEQEMIGGSPQQHQQQQSKKNGRPLTVEELEREMRGQPIPMPPGGRPPHRGPAPIGTPPQGGYMQQHMQQRMPNNNKPYSSSPGQPFSSSPHAPGYSHSTAPITIAKRGTPPPPGFQGPRCPSAVVSALLRANHNTRLAPTPSPSPSPPLLISSSFSPTTITPTTFTSTALSPPILVRPVLWNPGSSLPAYLTTPPVTPTPISPATLFKSRTPTPPLPYPGMSLRSPVQWSPSSSPSSPTTPTGSLTPTEVKHRLAIAITNKILSSSMNGSPAERHGSKNMPPFLSNTPVQQRMPFPGGFNESNRGRGPHHHQGPPPSRGHMMNYPNKPGYEPRFPNDRHPGDRFQNGRHPGDRFPPGERYPGPPMDERYGPPGPGDRFPNGDFHGRHPGDHHMDRGGRGFNHMDRGRGFNGRGGRGFDGPGGPMDHPGRGGFDMRMRGGPPDMRGGRGGFDMRGRGRGFHHYGRWRQNSFGEDDDYEMAQGDRDEFSNLMTQKEKDWIIKIQLMQIHTNDPYLDDYYFTKWQMEKLIRERAAKADSKGEPKLVLPQLAKADGRMYKPVQFEGSLGRLTASSVHNPRQIIDVKVKTNTGDEEGRHKEVRRFKQLLIHIEKSYDLLLDIDDVEKRAMALPEDSRPPLFKERAGRIHELYELLHLVTKDDISFIQLLTVRKGTKLVARTIPFLAKDQAFTVVSAILQAILTVIKRDLQDDVMAQLFEPMACVLSDTDLEMLVFLTSVVVTPVAESQLPGGNLPFMLQSKFGASMVWSIVSRGEAIFRTVSPVDLDVAHQNAWTSFLHTLGDAAMQTQELAQPFYVFPTVPPYLQRALGMSTYNSLEERLNSALTPQHLATSSTPHAVQVAS